MPDDAERLASDATSNFITLPMEDYKRLLIASELDDTLVRCEGCGAWLDILSPDTVSSEDGCYGDVNCYDADGNKGRCKDYRCAPRDPTPKGS